MNVERLCPPEGVVTERTATPTLRQPRPLLQDWALSNLLTSALTKINSQVASPGESLEPGCRGVSGSSQLFPPPLSCLHISVSPRAKRAGRRSLSPKNFSAGPKKIPEKGLNLKLSSVGSHFKSSNFTFSMKSQHSPVPELPNPSHPAPYFFHCSF